MQITTTLNRLHKFVERLSLRNKVLQQEVMELAQPVRIQLAKGMNVVPLDQVGRSQKVVELMSSVYEVSKTICGIKTQIMNKNSSLGISALLIEQQQQVFAKNLMTNVKHCQDNGSATVPTTQAMLNGLATATDAEPLQVSLNGIDEVLDQKLAGIIQEYETRINDIADQVSDLNKEKATVEVPDNLLPFVGVSNGG